MDGEGSQRKEMKRRFWQFVHDRLESAWHWVYYHKLAKYQLERIVPSNVSYSFKYGTSAIHSFDVPQSVTADETSKEEK